MKVASRNLHMRFSLGKSGFCCEKIFAGEKEKMGVLVKTATFFVFFL